MSDKFEKIYYLETPDGNIMRVPESKLDAFRNLNKKVKTRAECQSFAKELRTKDKSKK